MARVYIETTIPSYYFETRTSPQVIAWRDATRRWWDHYSHHYELVTSGFVVAELHRSPQPKSSQSLSLLDSVPLLDEAAGVRDVAAYYIEHQLMPKGAAGDAAHLAMASVHAIDFLLTWNCQHLANANKVRHLAVLNARLGLPVPVLATPMNLIPEEP
ncbi:MAG: hypothetical protein ACF8R7_09430 [Phycisphaerales bacterium JB039]